MTDIPLTRMKLKLELAQARRLHIAEEREEAQQLESERTAKLRAMRLAKDEEEAAKRRGRN